MRILFTILSVAFALYGLLPYNKAFRTDTTKPNQLIVRHQECGCPCPNGAIVGGHLKLADSILSKYQPLDTTQLNLEIEDLGEYNSEIMQSKFFVKGEVVGADTILCTPENCELVPRFKVASWSLVDSVARFWTFPVWMFLLFLMNLFMIFPVLSIAGIAIQIGNITEKKKCST